MYKAYLYTVDDFPSSNTIFLCNIFAFWNFFLVIYWHSHIFTGYFGEIPVFVFGCIKHFWKHCHITVRVEIQFAFKVRHIVANLRMTTRMKSCKVAKFAEILGHYQVYRCSKYETSTSLRKYENIKLFSATFIEHMKCIFIKRHDRSPIFRLRSRSAIILSQLRVDRRSFFKKKIALRSRS